MQTKDIHDKIYAKIEELPTLPAVVPRILSLIEDARSNASDVTGAVSRDPALTAKILKVANSAYYGFSQKIAELDMAVSLLGFNMVKSLALSIGVMGTLPRGKKSPYFSREGLWLHSLAVAAIMREMAKRHKKNGEREYLFVLGLLHDTGKIVMDQFFYDDFQQALEELNNDDTAKLHLVEKKIIGIDHCEVSSMLLKRWKFPDKIVKPIDALHHDEIPGDVDAKDVALLRISNAIAQELALGVEGNVRPHEISDRELKMLGMKKADIDAIRDHAHKEKNNIKSLFNAMV